MQSKAIVLVIFSLFSFLARIYQPEYILDFFFFFQKNA